MLAFVCQLVSQKSITCISIEQIPVHEEIPHKRVETVDGCEGQEEREGRAVVMRPCTLEVNIALRLQAARTVPRSR